MTEILQLGAIAIVGAVFVLGLFKDWEGVYLVFGLLFLLGSCKILGV